MVLEDISRHRLAIGAFAGILIGVLLTLAAVYATRISGELGAGVLALLGVLIGAGISGLVSFAQAQVTAKAQVAAATWLKRLEVHQEALTIWEEMLYEGYEETSFSAAMEWWKRNCLFMSGEAMDKCYTAIVVTDVYKRSMDTREIARHVLKVRKEAIKAIIEGAGRHIPDDFIKRMNNNQRPTVLTIAGD